MSLPCLHVQKFLGLLALQAGAKHGLGTYTWPNGATYSGEWQTGCMHGVGTFEGPDGTIYQARPSYSLECVTAIAALLPGSVRSHVRWWL